MSTTEPTTDGVAPSPEGATAAMDDTDAGLPQAGIGWLRAIGTGLAVVVVGFAVTVWLANWLLTAGSLSGLSRDNRVWLATAIFVVAVIAIAWGLRRLQARGII